MAWTASSKGAVHVGGGENVAAGVEAVHWVAEKQDLGFGLQVILKKVRNLERYWVSKKPTKEIGPWELKYNWAHQANYMCSDPIKLLKVLCIGPWVKYDTRAGLGSNGPV